MLEYRHPLELVLFKRVSRGSMSTESENGKKVFYITSDCCCYWDKKWTKELYFSLKRLEPFRLKDENEEVFTGIYSFQSYGKENTNFQKNYTLSSQNPSPTTNP